MIWLIFKKCCNSKSVKPDEAIPVRNPKKIIKELLSELDVVNDLDEHDDRIFITDKHFASLSVIDSHNNIKESVIEIFESDQETIENFNSSDNIKNKMNKVEDVLDATVIINNRCTKITEIHLKSLQCPFTWDLEPNVWGKNIVNRIENKYGKFNMKMDSSLDFSFERYISNLMICCGLFKTNNAMKAYDRILDLWRWLDKLDETNDQFYLAIRSGLKHIMMSTFCHMIYVSQKAESRRIFEMITPFHSMHFKSKAAVYSLRSIVGMEYGSREMYNITQYTKKACDLDSDTPYWSYFHSVAMTAQRQYLNTYESCPTESEFDAIQYAIILMKKPNPYFNYHRMNLMKNKIICHHYTNKSYINKDSLEKVKQDYQNIVELIKAVVSMEPDDPHLVVNCARSLITLPYLSQDDIHLFKEIISIAINMALNDSTVIEAIKRAINIYRAIIEEKNIMKKTYTSQIQVNNNEELDLEVNLKLIAEKHKKGDMPVTYLINLMEKYEQNNKWKILAQICSYSILFKESVNLRTSVERFMMLIDDKNIANSDLVTNHNSIFLKDSKIFNLAELVCNEIKLAIIYGYTKNQKETQYFLDQLTKIVEVCQVKLQEANPNFTSEILGYNEREQQNISQHVVTVHRVNDQKTTDHIKSHTSNKKSIRFKPCTNNSKQVSTIKSRRKYRRKNVNIYVNK